LRSRSPDVEREREREREREKGKNGKRDVMRAGKSAHLKCLKECPFNILEDVDFRKFKGDKHIVCWYESAE